MTNERLDGSGTVCRHCGEKIEHCDSDPCERKGWRHSDTYSHWCEPDQKVLAEPAPAEPARKDKTNNGSHTGQSKKLDFDLE